MKKRFGFTLAEVLITLGIIGVVAAMTIPTLLQNTNSVRFASQFKKDLSTLSQAALMAQAQYDVDYSLISALDGGTGCGTQTLAAGNNNICGLLNQTLAGHQHIGAFSAVKQADGSTAYSISRNKLPDPSTWQVYSLADGSFVGVNPAMANCHLAPGQALNAAALQAAGTDPETEPAGGLHNCIGFVDVNGPTLPNREMSCADATKTKLDPTADTTDCSISMSGATMGDVFPIVFHDGNAEPATNAARMVLLRSK